MMTPRHSTRSPAKYQSAPIHPGAPRQQAEGAPPDLDADIGDHPRRMGGADARAGNLGDRGILHAHDETEASQRKQPPRLGGERLADWLVRAFAMPFREAHHVTGTLVAMAEGKGCDLPDLTLADMQSVHAAIRPEVFDVLGVENSVRSRVSYGGTAPDQVRAQVSRWQLALA